MERGDDGNAASTSTALRRLLAAEFPNSDARAQRLPRFLREAAVGFPRV